MSYLRRTKNGVSFGATVPAASDERLVHELTTDATVEGVSVRIYRGAENTLRLTLTHVPASGSPSDLVETVDGGKDYVDGDDDLYQWDTSVPVEDGDELVVEANNTDGTNAHNFRVNMDLDYMSGVQRAGRGIAETLGVI